MENARLATITLGCLLITTGCLGLGPTDTQPEPPTEPSSQAGTHLSYNGSLAVSFTITGPNATITAQTTAPSHADPYAMLFTLHNQTNRLARGAYLPNGVSTVDTTAAGQRIAIEQDEVPPDDEAPSYGGSYVKLDATNFTEPWFNDTMTVFTGTATANHSMPIDLWFNGTDINVHTNTTRHGDAHYYPTHTWNAPAAAHAEPPYINGPIPVNQPAFGAKATAQATLNWTTTNGTLFFHYGADHSPDHHYAEWRELTNETHTWTNQELGLQSGRLLQQSEGEMSGFNLDLLAPPSDWTYTLHANAETAWVLQERAILLDIEPPPPIPPDDLRFH